MLVGNCSRKISSHHVHLFAKAVSSRCCQRPDPRRGCKHNYAPTAHTALESVDNFVLKESNVV